MAKLQLSFILLLVASLLATDDSLRIDSKNHLLLVHKTPTCGCCKEWVKHAKNHGFNVTTQDHQSLEKIKSMYKITPEYRSCHTTISSNGFVFEGHIPSQYIEKFLSEDHPNAIGLTVPGMPLGSPGMDFDDRFMPYDVLILFNDGSSEVYAEVRK